MNKELENVFALYQAFTPSTAVYPKDQELLYLSLGLIGEMLEWYDSGYHFREAGDIWWYISQLCNYYDWNLVSVYESTNTGKDNIAVNLAEALKKYIRDGKDPQETVLKYMKGSIALIIRQYSFSINQPPIEETLIKILTANRDKLVDRQNRGVIKGDGDER